MNSTCDPLPAPALRAEADDAVFERAYVEGLLRDRESLWHALFAQSRDGVVVLDEAGNVSAARIEESSGHPILDRDALNAVKSLRYLPADAPREVVLPLRFRLQD